MTVCLDEKLFKALVSETNGFPFENYVEMSMLSELNVPYKMVENRETKADAFFIIADPYRTGKGVIGEIGKTITPAYLSCFNNDNSIPSGKQHVDLLKETLFKVWDVYELARIEEQRKKLVDVVDLSSVIGKVIPRPNSLNAANTINSIGTVSLPQQSRSFLENLSLALQMATISTNRGSGTRNRRRNNLPALVLGS